MGTVKLGTDKIGGQNVGKIYLGDIKIAGKLSLADLPDLLKIPNDFETVVADSKGTLLNLSSATVDIIDYANNVAGIIQPGEFIRTDYETIYRFNANFFVDTYTLYQDGRIKYLKNKKLFSNVKSSVIIIMNVRTE